MADIYYDDHMLGIFGMIANYCYGKGFDKEWVNHFWEGLNEQPLLYKEFIHFFDTGEVLGEYQLEGFTTLDTFVWVMERESVIYDKGRSGQTCDKDEMILRAFYCMIELYHDPTRWRRILTDASRNDIL